MKLPLDIGIKINISDPVVTFKEVMEGVNLNKYLIKYSSEAKGRDGYNPKVLLKIVLFAFIINVRSTRKIESFCRNDIKFMSLSDEETPSHMTICNFIKDYLLDTIDNISNDLVLILLNIITLNIESIMKFAKKIHYLFFLSYSFLLFPHDFLWKTYFFHFFHRKRTALKQQL